MTYAGMNRVPPPLLTVPLMLMLMRISYGLRKISLLNIILPIELMKKLLTFRAHEKENGSDTL